MGKVLCGAACAGAVAAGAVGACLHVGVVADQAACFRPRAPRSVTVRSHVLLVTCCFQNHFAPEYVK